VTFSLETIGNEQPCRARWLRLWPSGKTRDLPGCGITRMQVATHWDRLSSAQTRCVEPAPSQFGAATRATAWLEDRWSKLNWLLGAL